MVQPITQYINGALTPDICRELRAIDQPGERPERLAVLRSAVSALDAVIAHLKQATGTVGKPGKGSRVHEWLTAFKAAQRIVEERIRILETQ